MELFDQLPEEVLSHVISLTTPRDACVSSVLSHAFRSAADSDATWQHFLPSDYASFLSQAVHPVAYASFKELYFQLCDHPLLIDGGLVSSGLEKSSGAKIFMISARRMSIVWGGDDRYWDWIALDDTRFEECAELKAVCWLEMCGKIKSEILTPNTSYAAYLIFKLTTYTRDLGSPFQKAEVRIAEEIISRHQKVCLNTRNAHEKITEDVILPTRRQDGWQEVELGVFYNGSGVEGEVCMSFWDTSGHWKRGLIVQGIEIRPVVLSNVENVTELGTEVRPAVLTNVENLTAFDTELRPLVLPNVENVTALDTEVRPAVLTNVENVTALDPVCCSIL